MSLSMSLSLSFGLCLGRPGTLIVLSSPLPGSARRVSDPFIPRPHRILGKSLWVIASEGVHLRIPEICHVLKVAQVGELVV
jgi:hypothetical protein